MTVNRLILAALAILVLCSPCFAAQTLFRGDEKVPAYATVLFDGKSLSEWVDRDGKPAAWKVRDGYMEIGGGDILTKQEFGDFQLHLEFWLPNMGDARGQGRANSGVYLQNAYEIQILDSYGLASKDGDCGGIYSIAPPMVNACRPPEFWQTYDIVLRAPKFDAQGKRTSNAVVTILQNGVVIHSCVEIPHATPGGVGEPKTGPLRLQDHGCPIRFRYIWIRPLDQPAK